MGDSRPPPARGLLLLLVTVQVLVLLVVLARGLQIFWGLRRIDMAERAGFLRLLRILGLTVRSRSSNQEPAQHERRVHNQLQSGHDASESETSNCIATR